MVEFLALAVGAAVEPTSLLVAVAEVVGLQSLPPLLDHLDRLLRETLIFKGLLVRVVKLDHPLSSGRRVNFGTPSRQLAYDLNLPAIQQAAVNPNSYRNYLSQYKQLFG